MLSAQNNTFIGHRALNSDPSTLVWRTPFQYGSFGCLHRAKQSQHKAAPVCVFTHHAGIYCYIQHTMHQKYKFLKHTSIAFKNILADVRRVEWMVSSEIFKPISTTKMSYSCPVLYFIQISVQLCDYLYCRPRDGTIIPCTHVWYRRTRIYRLCKTGFLHCSPS